MDGPAAYKGEECDSTDEAEDDTEDLNKARQDTID